MVKNIFKPNMFDLLVKFLQKSVLFLLICLHIAVIHKSNNAFAITRPEVTLGVEASGNEMTSDSYEYGISPEVKLEWAAYNFSLGLFHYLPYYPEFTAGETELYQEYLLHTPLWWLDIKLGNNDKWIYEDSALEGVASVGPVIAVFQTEVDLPFEIQYLPEPAVDFVPSVVYEFGVLNGIAGIGVVQTVNLYESVKLRETEFPITYEFDAGDYVTLGFEIAPVMIMTGPGFDLNAAFTIETAL
jgi:hypothetical protein